MSDRENRTGGWTLSRREVIGGLTAAAALVPAATAPAFIRDLFAAGAPVVETTAGKVRGSFADGAYAFLCVPYGADTSGAGRFMPPRPPRPWAGVREIPEKRPIAPQTDPAPAPSPKIPALVGMLSIGSEEGSVETEDCLNLTIHTPGLDNARRPVMFWCHGGGYAQGSGSAKMYHGAALARAGDVVVVSVTHRLNVLGFAHLAGSGPDFASSGNVGMQDIVLALEWVKRNIRRFGGDPDRVLVFGQSGGGGKVAALLSMPSARGLFQRAAMQSGSTRRFQDPDDAARAPLGLFAELGLRPDQGRELQKVPLERLMAAHFAASKRPGGTGRYAPVHDGSVIPRHPFHPTANSLAAPVPLVIGTVRTEGTAFQLADEAAFKLDEAGLLARMKSALGDRGEEAVALYRKLMPGASPSDLYFEMTSDRGRRAAIEIAELKTAQAVTPAYLYELTWSTPVYDGLLRTPHSLDLPLVFNLADHPVWAPYTGGVPESLQVSRAMMGAWVAFARTGSPGTRALPWPAFTLDDFETMVFDVRSEARKDPFRETRRFWEGV
ncbi:MAG: carboxylesterase/lipase family protein [Acidobacteria bacterium]|nr:carboxylesterase/lipase family protein [Acidobacteriota bacterium]